jgi:hypothetical protein
LDTRHRKIDTGNIGSFCVLCPMFLVSVFLYLLSNVTRICLYVSCVQCNPYLSFCVLCPMLPVSIFLCLVSNVTRVYLSVSCVQCYPCLSFFIFCPMLHVSIFLCLVSTVIRVCLSVYLTLDTINRKIDTGNIGHKIQKGRHV